jgi:hypothetical protein
MDLEGQSDRNGKSAVDKVNEFILKPKIKAISISMTDKGVLLLYQEKT